jgi:CBS-domain-containing membrane protein
VELITALLIAASSSSPAAQRNLFRHADGSKYGHTIRPHTIAAHTQVFSALRHLGFRERDIHAALGELRQQNDLQEHSTERLLREALTEARPTPRQTHTQLAEELRTRPSALFHHHRPWDRAR